MGRVDDRDTSASGDYWLGGDHFVDFGQIEADIAAMEQFAGQLSTNLELDYAPHLTPVAEAMQTQPVSPPAEFVELVSFLTVHNNAQDAAQRNVFNFANGTLQFAVAAKTISGEYRGSDAFAQATVKDVNEAFNSVQVPSETTSVEGDL